MFRHSGKFIGGWLAVASLVIVCTMTWGDEGDPPVNRAAVPKVSEQEAARKLLGDLFQAEFEQSKKIEEKTALAEKMLQVGNETHDDLAGQYMLFQIAKEIAIGAPNAETALKAVDAQGTYFEIDLPATKLATVTAVEKNLKFSKDRQALLATLDQLIEEFLQAERYDKAKKATSLTLEVARKVPDAVMLKQATTRLKEIEGREKLFSEVQAARKVLETKPDDPTANTTVGRYLCLVKSDWEAGLPILVKSGDTKLKAVAEQELAKPQGTDKQVELADGWWDLAEKDLGPLQSALQQRAVAWYQTALPEMSGLAKVKITGRIEKAGSKRGEVTPIATSGPAKSTVHPPKMAVKPTDAVKIGDHYYKVFMTPMPWGEAAKSCKLMGGHLTCLETTDEQAEVNKLKKQTVAWIGGYRKDDKFFWVNGEEVLPTRIADRQEGHDYLTFTLDGRLIPRRMDGTWNGDPANTIKMVQGFICEWDE